jgi:hypothetical protein
MVVLWRELFYRWQQCLGRALSFDDLSKLITFWETYPLELLRCRNAIDAIVGKTCQVLIAEETTEGPVTWLPAVFSRSRQEQLAFSIPALNEGYTKVRLLTGNRESPPLVVRKFFSSIAATDPATETWITEDHLQGAHKIAENALIYEMERRQMDSSVLERSGQLCRAVCGRIDNIGSRLAPRNGKWPGCFTQDLLRLLPSEHDVVIQAASLLLRLRRKLALDLSSRMSQSQWQFSPGVATYKEKTIQVSGINAKLLRALVESNRAITESELIDAGWSHDASVEPKTLKNHISAIRRTLKRHLNLDIDHNPIPAADSGRNLAWKIADFLR